MFRRIEGGAPDRLSFTFEGRRLEAREGDTIAAALLAAAETRFRTTPVSGAERGPFCLMGVCFDCLVDVDGVPNRQACMIKVADGMTVRRQQGAVEADVA